MLLGVEPLIHVSLVDDREQLEEPFEVSLLCDRVDFGGQKIRERVHFLRQQRGAENVVHQNRPALKGHRRQRRVGQPFDRASIDPVHVVHRLVRTEHRAYAE